MHGFRLAQPQVGERAALIGLGLLGLLTAQIAAAAGCEVFGIDDDPLSNWLPLGIQSVVRCWPPNRHRHSHAAAADVVHLPIPPNDPVNWRPPSRDRFRGCPGAVGRRSAVRTMRKSYVHKFAVLRPGSLRSSYEQSGMITRLAMWLDGWPQLSRRSISWPVAP
jgi:hypothetical protein